MDSSEIVAVTAVRSLVTPVTAQRDGVTPAIVQRSIVTPVTAIRKPRPSIELALEAETIDEGQTVTLLDRPMTFDATVRILEDQTVTVAGTLVVTGK